MRLLNVRTLQFQEFLDHRTPPYIILSHRWGEEEVSYKQFRKAPNLSAEGYRKILDFCTTVKRRRVTECLDGVAAQYEPMHATFIEWVWIDTCCIDKRSSAELSEAINSMYRWYGNAQECYVHLADVGLQADGSLQVDEFLSSDWFDRGWTLQELLAPRTVVFFDVNWAVLGHKCPVYDGTGYDPGHDPTAHKHGCFHPRDSHGLPLNHTLAGRTSIPLFHLKNASHGSLSTVSVAARMSWAARRTTSRIEDQAYCLLGIFDISIPLLYGEGDKAFRRLQEEIIKRSRDLSIFAWVVPPHELDLYRTEPDALRRAPVLKSNQTPPGSILASHICQFAHSGNILSSHSTSSVKRNVTITNEGVNMSTQILNVLQNEVKLLEPKANTNIWKPKEMTSDQQLYCITLDSRLDADSLPLVLFLEKVKGRYYRAFQSCLGSHGPAKLDDSALQHISIATEEMHNVNLSIWNG